MKRKFITAAFALVMLFGLTASAWDYSWSRTAVDGSRTGCVSTSGDNVRDALGIVSSRGVYTAPSGRTFKKCSSTAKAAAILVAVQPQMAPVKEKVGYAPQSVYKAYPESPLSNMFIDVIMASVGRLSGERIDIGVGNFGGIRLDELNADILLDDLKSMFPFKNQIVYVRHKGSTIRKMLEDMAAGRFQVLGGVHVEVEDGKIVKALVGGESIDDDKEYGMATISFLLNGGDKLYLGKDALEVRIYDVDIIDIMLDYIKGETAAGRGVSYQNDSRITIR